MSTLSVRLYNEVMMLDSFTCVYCGKQDPELAVDHVVPRSVGGADITQNLVAACQSCNSKKGGRAPYEAQMIALYGRYAYVQQYIDSMAVRTATNKRLADLQNLVRTLEREGQSPEVIGLALYKKLTWTDIDPDRLSRVRDLLKQRVGITAIVKEVWGVKTGGGRAYIAATQELQDIIAQIAAG